MNQFGRKEVINMETFNIWLTESCNMACKYCYEGEKKNNRLEKKTANQIIQFIEKECKSKTCKVIFHGGEPLLEFSVMEYIANKLVKMKNVLFFFTTNALLLNDRVVEFVKKYNIAISVSIDGNMKNHNKNRVYLNGKGTYDDVMQKIKLLSDIKRYVRVRMTITPDTIEDLFINVKEIIDNEFYTIVAMPDLFNKSWKFQHIKIIKEQIKKINKYINECKKDCDFTFFEDCNDVKNRYKLECNGGINGVTISVRGELFPCIYMVNNEEYCLGNIWNGIRKDKVDELKKIYKRKNVQCDECDFSVYCLSTRCKFLNLCLTSDINGVSPVICNFENLVYESMIKENN